VAEPLDSIIGALLGRAYEITEHVWENYVLENDRPAPDEIIRIILDDDPIVLGHDRNDPQGAACDLEAYNENGRRMFIRIGYAHRPIRLITAYWLDAPLEGKDG